MTLRCLSVCLLLLSAASAYIVSHQAVPVGRQMKWLKELTKDIVHKDTALTEQDLSASHDLMYAWSTTAVRDKECALAVESLLKRVVDERVAGNEQAELTIDDYNCLLEGWARSGQGEAAALRTETILEAMEVQGPTPDLASFKACLMAWRHAGVPYAAVRAQRILEWMIRLYTSGENTEVLPDADCFDIVLQIWSRSGLKESPKKTELLLGVMEKLHRSTGFNHLKPRKTSFNAVLAAWSKSGSPAAADRALAILNFMEMLAEIDPSVKPDSVSYNIVMGTYAQSKRDAYTVAVQADAFLRHAVDQYKKDQSNDVNDDEQSKPDTILFNTAMGLWAKAKRPGSYRQARSILDRQLSLEDPAIQPDVFGWTSVISSCAAESGNVDRRNKAFQVALSTYRQLQKLDVKANHVTYGTMLKACAKLLPASSQMRRKWVRQIFADSVSAGCVGDMVVSKLREAATPDIYRELMQGHSKRRLPAEWTKNVLEKSSYRTKNSKKVAKRKRAEV